MRLSRRDIYAKTVEWFSTAMPVAEPELHYGSPFQLLVAVILSAQCTDRRVNTVTPRLFADYPTAECMSLASEEVLLDYVKSVSYPNSKARHLLQMSRMLMEQYGGEVPSDGKELEKLPGVGRKTANVIQAVIFGKSCMAVDTHVFRVAHRIGLVPQTATTPLAVEKCLTRNFPQELIPKAHHWLILHGRYTCTARKPKCETCGLNTFCKYAKDNHS